MLKEITLIAILLLTSPVSGIDLNLHIKAKGVGYKTHDIDLNYKNIVFKDRGSGDVVLQKESRKMNLSNGLYHELELNLESTDKNMWHDTECVKNYNVGALMHLSYDKVKNLDSVEYLKTDNETMLHELTTKMVGKAKMDVEVANVTSKLTMFEYHETLVGQFEINKEVFVK